MIQEMEIKEPYEFQHNKSTLSELFKILETDFYGRYKFEEMQRVILEDRRIRLNAWVAKILSIPVQKIKRNKHMNPRISKKERADPKSLHFTLNRVIPLTSLKKKDDITFVRKTKNIISFHDLSIEA